MDRLSPQTLRSALKSERFGRPIHYFPVLDSTNETARALAETGAEEGAAVVADSQRRGRGRQGRSWFSPPGEGICLSLILRPEAPPARIPGLTLLAAVAVSRAIEIRTGLKPALKWPNDILLEGRKVGGILAESGADPAGRNYLVLGIGVNVHGRDFPPEIRDRATSLWLSGAADLRRADLIAEILARLEEFYPGFAPGGDLGGVIALYRKRSATLGRRVRVVGGGEEISGLALDLTAEGALRLRRDDGREITIHSGEISLRND